VADEADGSGSLDLSDDDAESSGSVSTREVNEEEIAMNYIWVGMEKTAYFIS
jgi:hypothetical protein